MEQWCNGCRVRIASDLKPDRQRRVLHKSNLPVTSRKIGPVLIIPLSFWGYAVETAAFTLNRVPSKFVVKTPHEMWTGKSPSLSFFENLGL